jgi:multidrug transporter EmrE-like cation transporter
MTLSIFTLLMLGVLLNAGAQLLLKAGVNHISDFQLAWNHVWQLSTQLITNPYIMLGLGCYAISVLVWLVVLSKIEVSVAYPMLSLGFMVNAIAAYYLFGEDLNLIRIMGIATIILGVFIVARSH